MRHEKRFFAFSIYGVLTCLLFTAYLTSIPLSGSLKQLGSAIHSSAYAESRPDSRNTAQSFLLVSEGKASYYANQFHGKKTANGETFNMNELTAAHPSLPFGTRVRVTNLRNGKDVIVRINDRGPFVKGRIIDLSAEAAKEIGLFRAGTAQVRVEAINKTIADAYSG
ncbi:MAG: septal ring lytic transglycosylase RlpA family protein [Chlorobium sp.]|uniref:septal ring lytic transglycosylase RlpA family protein n=1 Tax=Chlorobium sp. TaxID=1095 RepID=UPI0025C289B9|nr:septal ring lytic transglycosylase RlpA family protein [Chlorobium sp.]MCF8383534.1 septal ring lytic transglycosylase RlpA family protein [Chlorobium sp.]